MLCLAPCPSLGQPLAGRGHPEGSLDNAACLHAEPHPVLRRGGPVALPEGVCRVVHQDGPSAVPLQECSERSRELSILGHAMATPGCVRGQLLSLLGCGQAVTPAQSKLSMATNPRDIIAFCSRYPTPISFTRAHHQSRPLSGLILPIAATMLMYLTPILGYGGASLRTTCEETSMLLTCSVMQSPYRSSFSL